MKNGYIPKHERKTILLLSDDSRMPSGVGVMSKEIIMKTAHRYNWVQVGAALHHPEMGKVVEASDWAKSESGVEDASLKIYPNTGYGNGSLIRHILDTDKPAAIIHFTDPRYWIWLYELEHEIRQRVPLMFYHVWDNVPFPKYNEDYYRSCDHIAAISKQTYNIVRQVWKKNPPEDWQVKYIPHGADAQKFKRLTTEEDLNRLAQLKAQIFGNECDVQFVVMYNNRNIRRKMTGDVILAYREFLLKLPEAKRDQCRLLLHTQPVDDAGTDLVALIRDVAPEIRVVFSSERIDTTALNDLYNISDVVINMANAEGFGIGTLEAMLAERMTIATVTGGLQDQMGFRDDEGNLLDPDIHFGPTWGSNHDGRYTTHGEWTIPLFPKTRTLIGSPPTPYIFEDHADWVDAANAIRTIYDMSPEERQRRGTLGREYALQNGFTADQMGDNFIAAIDTTLQNWIPRKKFTLIKS